MWLTGVVFACAASARASQKPVSYGLVSLPTTAEDGQKLVLCAANIGTGAVDVQLEFINVATGNILLKHVIPAMGDMRLRDVDNDKVQTLVKMKIEEGYSVQTAIHIRNVAHRATLPAADVHR